MLIGYARISTTDQTLDLQKDALQGAGCDRIFTDTASGAKAERTGLDQALSHIRTGDTLVVWRLDRLGRSLKRLIETITALNNRQIGFKSITESIDTTSWRETHLPHLRCASEFERDIIRERTQAGLTAARARGRKGSRPKALTPKKAQQALTLYDNKNYTIEKSAGRSISHERHFIAISKHDRLALFDLLARTRPLGRTTTGLLDFKALLGQDLTCRRIDGRDTPASPHVTGDGHRRVGTPRLGGGMELPLVHYAAVPLPAVKNGSTTQVAQLGEEINCARLALGEADRQVNRWPWLKSLHACCELHAYHFVTR
jgi:DNA invertase Pin-like site-specific DNA recombinase